MTVDGGALLYGLGGEDPTRPDALMPFELAGAAERIDLVAQTSIRESPAIEIRDIASEQTPGKGYLLVVVPPSPRAPHMLTIDGDNRYWGRGETGNRKLDEAEVSRLYLRRERQEIDRARILNAAASEMPFAFDENHGPMLVWVRPVFTDSQLLARASGDAPISAFLQNEFREHARDVDPIPGQGTHGLGDAHNVKTIGADHWVLYRAEDPRVAYQARAEFSASGELRYWVSPTIFQDDAEREWLMEDSVTRATVQAVRAVSWLYERAGYHGSVDVGVANLGLANASGASRIRLHAPYGPPRFEAPDFTRHARVSMAEMSRDSIEVARPLLMPLFDAISVGNFNAFADLQS